MNRMARITVALSILFLGFLLAPISTSTFAKFSWKNYTGAYESTPSIHLSGTLGASTPVHPGDALQYRFTIQNTGNTTANDVILVDPLPQYTSFVGANLGGTLQGNQEVKWEIGQLAPMASASLTLTVQVDEPLDNLTVISNQNYWVDCGNCSAQLYGGPIQVSITSAPVLSIVKTANPSPVVPGELLTYTITANNTGDMVATGAEVSDIVPANTTLISTASNGQVQGSNLTWNLGQMPIDTPQTVTFTVRVNKPLAAGTQIVNSNYTVTCDQGASASNGPLRTNVIGASGLRIEKTTSVTLAQPGDIITYTLTLTNGGTYIASGITVTDPLPAGVEFVSASHTGELENGMIFWSDLVLNYGSNMALTLVTRVDPETIQTSIVNEQYTATSLEGHQASGQAVNTPLDLDQDGVGSDVENGGPNNGDGNNDGIPDSQQANVTSLPNLSGAAYVTLVSPAGTTLINVNVRDNPASESAPEDVVFLDGFFSFTNIGIQAGISQITLILHHGQEPRSFWKYGPTPDYPTPHWYEFLFDGRTGAVIQGSVITLYYVDGLRGDADLAENGSISDPGAPVRITQWKIRLPMVQNK